MKHRCWLPQRCHPLQINAASTVSGGDFDECKYAVHRKLPPEAADLQLDFWLSCRFYTRRVASEGSRQGRAAPSGGEVGSSSSSSALTSASATAGAGWAAAGAGSAAGDGLSRSTGGRLGSTISAASSATRRSSSVIGGSSTAQCGTGCHPTQSSLMSIHLRDWTAS